MKKKIFFALVCLFIAAVSGRCDRNAISACFTSWSQSGDMQTQCAAYENIKKCIAPHKDACAGDPTLAAIAPLEQMCSGGYLPNIPNVCAVDVCAMGMQQYQPKSSGEPIEVTPELCAAASKYKTCVEQGKSQCPDSQSVTNAEMLIESYETLCGGCTAPKLMKCTQMLGDLMTEDFERFPTHEQINTVCPKLTSFKNCISPIKTKCDAMKSSQAQQISKGIEAAFSYTDLMCGADFKAGFMKHGMECFDKASFKNATSANCASMMAPKPEPESSSASPEPESKTQECQRTTSMFECYVQQVEAECGEDAVEFISTVKGRFMNVILVNLNCPTSGQNGVETSTQRSYTKKAEENLKRGSNNRRTLAELEEENLILENERLREETKRLKLVQENLKLEKEVFILKKRSLMCKLQTEYLDCVQILSEP
ncbi:uncharacterized protein LOC127735488 isoform X2 [Mytilus californianus]|uniref:uncharacterized protein LOC127735488 isoform X2 n=1 Tax=Mytilus californianus TaxID=6549 RepID=UPI002247713D|nr:uncharacterized protein LOC127735488 isoform X2 [Mytilus californianus]